MISTFTLLLGALLLTSLVVLVDSAPTCTSEDLPSERSLSLIPRNNHRAQAWAGFQHRSWTIVSRLIVDYATVSFRFPTINTAATPNSRVGYALTLGTPGTTTRGPIMDELGKKVILVGIQVEVTHGFFVAYPVYGTSFLDFRLFPETPENLFPRPITAGDLITLQIYNMLLADGRVIRRVVVQNRSAHGPWAASAYITGTDVPACFTSVVGMVYARRTGVGWWTLTKFGTVTFTDFRVIHRGAEHTPISPPGIDIYWDMHRARTFAYAQPGQGVQGITSVVYVLPAST